MLSLNKRRPMKIIEMHKFFIRKSQHYIMGNWYRYEHWIKNGSLNKNKLRYITGLVPAYIKFMYLSIYDECQKEN